MRRIDPNVVAGMIMTALCLILAVPMALEQLDPSGGRPLGPSWLWWAIYAVFLAALILGGWLDEWIGAAPTRWLLAVMVVAAAALVLLAPAFGWLPILLVFTAALSVYHVPYRVTAVIVLLNCGVVVVVGMLGGSQSLAGSLTAGAIYLMLQLSSVLLLVALRREERSRAQLAEAHAELAAAGAVLAETSRAEERLRISRELHDLVGHQLTALALELEIATHRDDKAEHVDRARGIARDLLADVRSTVGELRRRAPDLTGTLQRITAQLPRPEVHLTVADDVEADEEHTVAVIRCVQEILTNAIRHADAANVWIEIDPAAEGGLRLHARDDGRGATGEIVPGNGLRGLAERTGAFGGTVDFGAAAPRGFTVTAVLP
ncbi:MULTISPECIES: sensor histidine kinase [Pseudonocardia]|uniref:Oxygen sensor histidine kinase NreB n=2 Tax=Pseudonocardia TaxID=1847 RepID=A0A1Y2MUQ9_PSEAH|nr:MULTISPECIES: histidine kinase [Pseudonocardia]OSY38537.1 Oxygen sensor histidine kinase NreB [Pseudonocardia autotrophica]TDN77020.1 signal transduction histidine kinase [Pseudonocardia autotrophica]BBG01026.1 two-component sensor histidine kinase [Pseudonocardia autotrophica]GEC26654.1 two-component sensor histidine kinase [Pseudonocardia saturnea]